MSGPAEVAFLPDDTELETELRTVGILPSPLVIRIVEAAFLSKSPVVGDELIHELQGISIVVSLSFSHATVTSSSYLLRPMEKVSPVVKAFIDFSASMYPSVQGQDEFGEGVVPGKVPVPVAGTVV